MKFFRKQTENVIHIAAVNNGAIIYSILEKKFFQVGLDTLIENLFNHTAKILMQYTLE